LGQGLGVRIVSEPPRGIRSRLIHATLIAAGKGNAGTARKDQPPHAAANTTADHVLRPHHIRIVVVLPASPDSSDRRRVKYDLDAAALPLDIGQFLHVAVYALDA